MCAGEGTAVAVFDFAAIIRRVGAGSVSGIGIGSLGAAQTLAHADPKGSRTLHPDEDVSRGRQRGAQASRQPVQDRAGEANEDRRLRRPAS